MIDIDLILERLKAHLTGFRMIGASADLDAAIDGAVTVPAAFCLPLAEAAGPGAVMGPTRQRIRCSFGVVLCVSNRRDAQGAAALGDLKGLRQQVRAALVGFVPDASTGEPVLYSAGRLLRLDGDGRLWWIDEFELSEQYRSA